jgi:predicted ATPase/class 3 adenylate cyclase
LVRRDLPSGTVTFLFTDVEGSTRLLDELGAQGYAAALGEHRRVVRQVVAGQGGVEVDTQGDAFFIAFPTVPGAIAAAESIQARLGLGLIRLRVGIHTGTPLVTEEGYVGADVHRAARIAAAGHGGQVLVSASSAALYTATGGGPDLVDLGEHRFKDLRAPERVFQLGGDEFPPIRSLSRGNLPVPATEFVGRERELAELVELFDRGGERFVTLTGPGGTGKTRLALQAAGETSELFSNGIWWVPLSTLRDPALVLPAAAQPLGLKEQAGATWLDLLSAALSGKRTLFLLDNAEHLLPQVADTASRLAAVDGVTLLVTSRERLWVQAEHVVSVPSLAERDAVELFTARAVQIDGSFQDSAAVSELCGRLDDLPLAIELAAARTALFSPAELIERLGERLDLFRGPRDADPRQQTLRATIEWSYDLLDPPEQRLFAGLSVFAGGCTYAAAEAVCNAEPDPLESLIAKNLVRRRETARGSRYWMLETIREFSAERLEAAGEAHALRAAHAEFFASLAERADPHLRHGPDQQGWADRIADDYDNIRSAIDFGLAQAPEIALRIVGSITFFVWLRGGFAEMRTWVDEALAAGTDASLLWRGRALVCGAVVAERQNDLEAERRYADEAFTTATAAGDGFGIASALRERGKAAIRAGDRERTRAIYEQLITVAEEVGDPWNGAIALNNLGDLALYDRDWAQAVELCGRSSEIRRSLGDLWGSALCLTNVASAQSEAGLLDDAALTLHQALEDSLAVNGTMVISFCFVSCAALAAARNRPEDAATLLGASARLHEELETGLELYELNLLQRAEKQARTLLGDEDFTRTFEHGHSLPLEDAAAFALDLTSNA